MQDSDGTGQQEGLISDRSQSCLELEETQKKKKKKIQKQISTWHSKLSVWKGDRPNIKNVCLKTTERSDLLNTIWNKEILPSGKQQLDTITITNC